MIKTLQKRFIFTAMIAVTILLIVLLGAINLINAGITIKQSNNMLHSLLRQEHSAERIPPEKDIYHNNFFTPPPTEDDRNATLFFSTIVESENNKVITETNRFSTLSEEEAVALTNAAITSGKDQGRLDRFRYGSVSTPMGTKYVFIDTSADRRDILRMVSLSLAAGALCWTAMLLLVTILSHRAIRPIAENIERQKQFITDAGHEIKTPLAIISANTEAWELHQGKTKWSGNIRDQIQRLNGLMQNLLTLAKAEENKTPVNLQKFSFSELTENTLEMFREPMELRGIKLQTKIEPDITITANKDQIMQLISILGDNAVKYAVPQSTVFIRLNKKNKYIVLETENACCNQQKCPTEKLFDRFYRNDDARTQNPNGGYGIGLSAAKAITELHGGEISAQYTAENKIRFTVKIPS